MIPAIFVPGLLCTGALFDDQCAGLSRQLEIGIGDITESDNIPTMAGKILDEAPECFVLFGFSLGGIVAQEIMRQAGSRVRALILTDTGARADSPEQTTRRMDFIKFAESAGMDQAMRKSFPLLLHEDRQDDEALTGKMLNMAEELGVDVFRRQQTALAGRDDYRSSLTSIACPSLVICGDADAMTPPELSRELADGIPGARLEFIANCGHLSVLERPDQLNTKVSRFVAEVTQREGA